jgi:hypothetical protein
MDFQILRISSSPEAQSSDSSACKQHLLQAHQNCSEKKGERESSTGRRCAYNKLCLFTLLKVYIDDDLCNEPFSELAHPNATSPEPDDQVIPTGSLIDPPEDEDPILSEEPYLEAEAVAHLEDLAQLHTRHATVEDCEDEDENLGRDSEEFQDDFDDELLLEEDMLMENISEDELDEDEVDLWEAMDEMIIQEAVGKPSENLDP